MGTEEKGALARITTAGQVARAIATGDGGFETEVREDHVERGQFALILGDPDADDDVPCLVGERALWVPRSWISVERPSTTGWRRAPLPEPEAGSSRDPSIGHYLAMTAQNLAHDLAKFWPATGNNEMAEANLVLQLGSELRSRRFCVYAEVPLVGEERTAHADLLAFNDRLALGVEAKRLYSSEKAAEMASDYWRLLDGGLPTYAGGPRIPDSSQPIVLIVATTWHPRIQSWWTSEDRAKSPRRGPGWGLLAEALEDIGQPGVGAHRIQDDPGGWGTQWLLYAWKARSEPFTATQPIRR